MGRKKVAEQYVIMSGAAARTGKEIYKEYKNIEDYRRDRGYQKRRTQHGR